MELRGNAGIYLLMFSGGNAPDEVHLAVLTH